MWEFINTLATTILAKENYVAFTVGNILGIVIGALACFVYFSYTESVLNFKRPKAT